MINNRKTTIKLRYNLDTLFVKSPNGKIVKLKLISRSEIDGFIEESTTKHLLDIKTITGNIPVFQLLDNKILVAYTLDDYGFIVNNLEEFQQITRNKSQDKISLHINGEKYYYGFNLNSNKISNLLKEKYTVVDGYGHVFKAPLGFEDTISRVIKFNDESILIFIERAPDIFQGTWFSDFNNFKYFYENGYTG